MENAIVESCIQGVSTRKIHLSLISRYKNISADTGSRMANDPDQSIRGFPEQPFEVPIIYLDVDTVYLKGRNHGRYVSKAVLIITGVRIDGFRAI